MTNSGTNYTTSKLGTSTLLFKATVRGTRTLLKLVATYPSWAGRD